MTDAKDYTLEEMLPGAEIAVNICMAVQPMSAC